MPPRRGRTGRYDLSPAAQYEDGYEDGYERGWNERAESDRLRGPVTSRARRRGAASRRAPGKRMPSAYSKAFGVIYKQLKKKHPRASFGSLSKKAHTATRKKRGMKKGKK